MRQEDAVRILEEVYTACSDIFPVSIIDAYLYGSYARGDYEVDSDVDIFLTVDMDWEDIAIYRRAVSRAVSRLSLKYDVTISVSVNPLKLFRQFEEDLPFYRNVREEGIRYVA